MQQNNIDSKKNNFYTKVRKSYLYARHKYRMDRRKELENTINQCKAQILCKADQRIYKHEIREYTPYKRHIELYFKLAGFRVIFKNDIIYKNEYMIIYWK